MALALIILVFQMMVSITFIRNLIAFRALPDRGTKYDKSGPLISVLIPARNEEAVVERVVRSATAPTYPNIEVIVLNDRSDDRTPIILAKLEAEFASVLSIYEGEERPAGWLGKPWACHQLSKKATGDILLFIDADTILDPSLCARIAEEFALNGTNGLVTVWPEQITISFWEKTIIPMIYYTLLSFLYSEHTRRDPRWMPKFLMSRFRPMFAAACGQCIAMPMIVYEAIGGHTCVKSDVVEDVGLARAVRSRGMPVRMYHGMGSIACRMYTDDEQISNGFRKNFLAGFGSNLAIFLASAIFHVLIFVLPYIMIFMSLFTSNYGASVLWAFAILLPICQRALLAKLMKWPLWTSLTHIIGVLWFQLLGITVIADKLLQRSVEWKGRKVTI